MMWPQRGLKPVTGSAQWRMETLASEVRRVEACMAGVAGGDVTKKSRKVPASGGQSRLVWFHDVVGQLALHLVLFRLPSLVGPPLSSLLLLF